MKKSNSGSYYPKVILGLPRVGTYFFAEKYVYKISWNSIHWFWRYSHVCCRQTDRQTNECQPYTGGARFFNCLKNYLPYSIRKFCFAHLLCSQGDNSFFVHKPSPIGHLGVQWRGGCWPGESPLTWPCWVLLWALGLIEVVKLCIKVRNQRPCHVWTHLATQHSHRVVSYHM